jgi:hypothetical protein
MKVSGESVEVAMLGNFGSYVFYEAKIINLECEGSE